MLECTGRYKDLVTNGIGGTLEHPCTTTRLGLCGREDVEAWRGAAEELRRRVHERWTQSPKLPPDVFAYLVALEGEFCTAESDGLCVRSRFPEASWWNLRHNADAAASIARWCARAACGLELLDRAATRVRSAVEATSPPPVFHAEVAALAKLAAAYSTMTPEAFDKRNWEALFLVNAALNGATEEGRAATKAELYQRWQKEWEREGSGFLGPAQAKWYYRTSDGKPPVIRLALDSALRNPDRTLRARLQLLQSIPPERRADFTEALRVLYGDIAAGAGAANHAIAPKMRAINRELYGDENWFDRPWLTILPYKGEPAPIEILMAHQVGLKADQEPTPEELALRERQGPWLRAIASWDLTFLRDNPLSQFYVNVTGAAAGVAGVAAGAAGAAASATKAAATTTKVVAAVLDTAPIWAPIAVVGLIATAIVRHRPLDNRTRP